MADLPLPTASYEEILILQEENDQRQQELQRALDTLTPRQKEIIVLKYFEELSYCETAERTGLEVNTLYKILHEGLKNLKVLLVTA